MKALEYNTSYEKHYRLIEKSKPKILNAKDAIVKVTLSSICTSDLHIINEQVPKAKSGTTLGHEYVGIVEEIGPEVKNIKVGDRVSANCETFCNECYYCKKGFINNCTNGGWLIGCNENGAQAEYVRVMYADNCLNKLPCNVSDLNALLVGDVLATGYFGAKMCEIENNDTIAVIGCGSVGLCSMMCSKVLGADKIIAIDINDNRLQKAKEQNLANYYLNPNYCKIKEEILKITDNRGADKVIEAAGTNESFELSWKIARANAIIGIVALYEENQILPLPTMYGKNLTFKTGGIDAIYSDDLIKLISEGKINTDFIFSHTFKLNEIEKAYDLFQAKKENCLKIAIEHE